MKVGIISDTHNLLRPEVVEMLSAQEIDGKKVIDDGIRSAIEAYYAEYGCGIKEN